MSTYSPSLRIELIGTGDQAGTWGNTTNTNLGTLIESAVAGYVSVSVTSANQALTALNGAADEARNQSIALTTTTGANFAVYAPPAEKTYVIYNASPYTATIYNSTVIGNTTAAGTGVAIPAGKTMTVWTEGTNFRVQNDHVIGNLVGNVAGTLTGTISSGTTATTQAPGTNNTTVATTAFVQNVAGNLGTMSTQNANNVAITGGTITGSYGLTAANATNLTGGNMACSGGTITSSAPTLFFVDTDGADFYIHVNSNLWYVLNQGGSGIIYTDQSGNFTAAANVTAYSDERLKTNWQALPQDFVAALSKVKAGTYERIDDNNAKQVGVSAQSLQKIMPEAVRTNPDGMLSVAYGNAALAAAVKLAERVVELEQRIAAIERKL